MKDYVQMMKIQGKKEAVFDVLQYMKNARSGLIMFSLMLSIETKIMKNMSPELDEATEARPLFQPKA